MELDAAQQRLLLDVARRAIEYSLDVHCRLPVRDEDYPQVLRRRRATFVTLQQGHKLRGCMGTLDASQSLVKGAADRAHAAAFADPRFSPLTRAELDSEALDISISILTPAAEICFGSEEDLIAQLRPGVDGLILQDDSHRGTYLPSVWASLNDKREFLNSLKEKAGFAVGYWRDDIRAWRYTTQTFSD